jgi:hypothetical protein
MSTADGHRKRGIWKRRRENKTILLYILNGLSILVFFEKSFLMFMMYFRANQRYILEVKSDTADPLKHELAYMR